MSRRPDPERIFQAWRAAVRYTGMDEATANRWCDAWELEAAGRQLPRMATTGRLVKRWIAAERMARRPVWSWTPVDKRLGLPWRPGLIGSNELLH